MKTAAAALVFGMSALASSFASANNSHPLIDEMISLMDNEASAEFQREMLESILPSEDSAEREFAIRFWYWKAFLSSHEDFMDMAEVFRAMLTTVDGCLLPLESCAMLKDLNREAAPSFPFAHAAFVLSNAVMEIGELGDCVPERTGFVSGSITDLGPVQFVLMDTSTTLPSPCFVRNLKG